MSRIKQEVSGFAMIEAIAAVALLAIVALGVLRGLDVAQRSSGREKARSAAAALTEQDQERLRSFRAVDLDNYDTTRTVKVNKIPYIVTSQVDWVRDSTGGTESCNSNTVQADYMRITSTTKSGLINTPIVPIKMSSLVAPPIGAFGANQGTLGVQVNNRNGVGVEGVQVTITGPATVTNPTNSAGCAIFAYVPIGTYTASVNQSGWVDKGGNNPTAPVGATVSQGQVKVANITYDRASSVVVNFDTEARDGTVPLVAPALSTQLSASNAGVPAGPLSLARIRWYNPPGGLTANGFQSTITADGLFPFTDGYGLFGGACPGADPTLYDSDYYDTFTSAHITTPQGATATPSPALVRLPSINLRVLYNNAALTGTNATTVHILVKSKSTGCTEAFDYVAPATDAAGWMLTPALPYGDYQLCADAISPATGTRRSKVLGGPLPTPWVQNRDPRGIKPPVAASPVIDLQSGTSNGACT